MLYKEGKSQTVFYNGGVRASLRAPRLFHGNLHYLPLAYNTITLPTRVRQMGRNHPNLTFYDGGVRSCTDLYQLLDFMSE